jgi:hypothetical protein
MATIQNPQISLGAGNSDTRPVTVSGTMKFDAADVGRSFRLEIAVYGDDSATDKRPVEDGASDDVIYTFKWPGLLLPLPYRVLTVQAAGNVPLSETRQVTTDALDEDSGKVQVGIVSNTPVLLPRADEIYAKVTLTPTSTKVSATTPTISSGIGA